MDKPFLAFITFFLAVILLVSCTITQTPVPSATPQITVTLTPTLFPTVTPTPLPIGTEQNPLILGIVSETDDPNTLTAADQIAKSVQQVTGFVIKTHTYPSYLLLLSDMAFAKVHIAFLPPLTYLYAKQMGYAQVAMLTNHFGVFQYGSRFFTNATSKFKSYYDPTTDRATAEATTALTQFQDKMPCWVDPASPSGYIVPLGLLKSKNIKTSSGAFLASPVGVIRALYVTGICDFGVTFTTTGDPRTSPFVTQDLTDVLNRIIVIWQTDPIIPNTNLSFHPSIKPDMVDDLVFGFKDLLKDDKGKSELTAAIHYEILDFKQVDETVYDPFRNLVNEAGVDLLSLVGR
ncbi:MAG TPA: PhnD/SsuA/transferrin family substrate-binding protein [Anaerolineaceae bacterium]